jgi:hypothetical protein
MCYIELFIENLVDFKSLSSPYFNFFTMELARTIYMDLTLQILLGLVTIICFLGGLDLLTKGSDSFLEEEAPSLPVLDNLFRFLSGIYFGLAFLMAWVVYNFHNIHHLIYWLGIIVIFSGLGRAYSRVKVGSAGKYFDYIMIFEIALGICIVILQYFR